MNENIYTADTSLITNINTNFNLREFNFIQWANFNGNGKLPQARDPIDLAIWWKIGQSTEHTGLLDP